MFCSNCGAELPPNGICIRCGVQATNMMFTGYTQGQPVVPQQQFYNPNPMYVQYQGPQQGYGQPFIPQENVAIGGIKDPKMVAGIGATIKEGCGSMMMVITALLTTLAMIFSFIELIYTAGNVSYGDEDIAVMAGIVVVFVRCIPFTLFTIGMWLITFHGYGTYYRKLYNDNACMQTAGFSTVQAGAIASLVPTAFITLLMAFMVFMVFIVGVAASFGMEEVLERDVLFGTMIIILVTVVLVLMIIMQSSLISQMAKIKHAIRGRNYESISILLPALLFVMAAFQIMVLIFSAIDEDVFTTLLSGVYSIWYAFTGCTLLYIRSKVNNYILGR